MLAWNGVLLTQADLQQQRHQEGHAATAAAGRTGFPTARCRKVWVLENLRREEGVRLLRGTQPVSGETQPTRRPAELTPAQPAGSRAPTVHRGQTTSPPFPRPAADSWREGRSGVLCGTRSSGMYRAVAIPPARHYIGILIRKIQCQEAISTSQPPRVGPTNGPIMPGTPTMLARRRGAARLERRPQHRESADREQHRATRPLDDTAGRELPEGT